MKVTAHPQRPEKEKDYRSASEIGQILLSDFFKAIARDPRINSTHIGVYAALVQFWYMQGQPALIRVYSHEMIGLAKLSCRDTYFKYVGELSAYGYIRYKRSFNRKKRSEIYFTFLDNTGRSGD